MEAKTSSQVRSVSPELPNRSQLDSEFRQVFTNESSYVWSSLVRLGVASRDVEDLVSDVFVRVHKGFSTYDRTRPIRPWLFAFAYRVASEYRKLARHRVESLESSPDMGNPQTAQDELVDGARARKLVEDTLLELDFDKRTVFIMHELDELPIPRVAEMLEIAEGTAYSRLRAARAEFSAEVRKRTQLWRQR